MWILFKYNSQSFSLEFRGEETLIDATNILKEVYEIESQISFFVDGVFITEDSYFKPLNEIPKLKGKDFVTIDLYIQYEDDEYPIVRPFVKQKRAFVIGQYESSGYSAFGKKMNPKSFSRESSQKVEYDTVPQKHVPLSIRADFEQKPKVTLPSTDHDLQAPRKIETDSEADSQKVQIIQPPQASQKFQSPRKIGSQKSVDFINKPQVHVPMSNKNLSSQVARIRPSKTADISHIQTTNRISRQSASKAIMRPKLSSTRSPFSQSLNRKT